MTSVPNCGVWEQSCAEASHMRQTYRAFQAHPKPPTTHRPMTNIQPPSLPVFLLCLTVIIVWARRLRTRYLPLPPGPPQLPLIGNLFNVPKYKGWETFHAWALQYDSDIIYLNIAGKSLVILDTYEAAVELLERRSSLYSSRPTMRMINDLMGWSWNFGFMPYGQKWRTQRRMMHHEFTETNSKQFRRYQQQSTVRMLKSLVSTPADYDQHFRLMLSQVMIMSIYGLNANSVHHPYVQLLERMLNAFDDIKAAIPGRYLVESIPLLKYVPMWFPGAQFRRDAEEVRQLSEACLDTLFTSTKQHIEKGEALQSFVSNNLAKTSNDSPSEPTLQQEEKVRNVSGVIYGAAIETSMASLLSFMYAIVHHPESMRRAQVELDTVIPNGQLPTLEEMDSGALPYVTALVDEVIRCYVVAPLSIPHSIDVEDVYSGYRIPAGSTVMSNSWAMLHDENQYPNPESFSPERFLNKDGSRNHAIRSPSNVAFGFGRRICPGRHFAYSGLWIVVARMLMAFDIGCELDQDSNPVDPKVEFVHNLSSFPLPFKCRIKPRSNKIEQLISELEAEDGLAN